ncbi:MAG: MFS transporter [Myxococcota bacterium]|nr:MFS transporter [Myxococcota bacterium]
MTPPQPASLPAAPRPPGYSAFVGGVASWFGAWGMQAVLFSWLVVGELRAAPDRVGVVQTSTMLPALVLLLFGGHLAERVDPRRLLLVLHGVAVLPVLALAAVVWTGQLSIPALIAYGVSIGTVSAFVMPARDTLLSRVAGGDMMRAVTGMTAVQFGAQACGSLVAGGARWAGSELMLLIQALALLVGSALAYRVPAEAPRVQPDGPTPSALREIADGLAIVARTPALRNPILLVMAVGLLFVGPFMVSFPLIVRDVYAGTVAELSLVMMLFPIGTIAGSVALRTRGGVRRKGLASLGALAVGAVALAAIGLGLPFWGFVAATFFWGLAGSVFINCSRTLYQEAAPSTQRGRVLSVYQIGFLGMAPVGAVAAGLVASEIGPLGALASFAAAMLTIVAAMALATNTARLE